MESKLPHCLKDCLGGNFKTYFLFAVRSEVSEYKQTLHSLNHAKDMQGFINHWKMNAFPLGNKDYVLNNKKRLKRKVELDDDVLSIPSEYESSLISDVKAEEAQFQREVLKGLLLDENDEDEDESPPSQKEEAVEKVVEAPVVEEEEASAPTEIAVEAVMEEPPAEEMQAAVEFSMDFEASESLVERNETDTQTDPIVFYDADKEKEMELLRKQLDSLQSLVSDAQESIDNVEVVARVSNKDFDDGTVGLSFDLLCAESKQEEEEKNTESFRNQTVNFYFSGISFSPSPQESKDGHEDGNLLEVIATEDSSFIYSNILSPAVHLVNSEIEAVDQLLNGYRSSYSSKSSRKSKLLDEFTANDCSRSVREVDTLVCFISSAFSETVTAVNDELKNLRKVNAKQAEEIIALKEKSEKDANTIIELRALLDEMKRAAEEVPPNSARMGFAKFSLANSDRKDGNNSEIDLLSFLRYEGASLKSERDDSSPTINPTVSSIVQYPSAFLTVNNNSFSATSNGSNGALSVSVTAFQDSNLQETVDAVNSQMKNLHDMATAQKRLCDALTQELEALKVARDHALSNAQQANDDLYADLLAEQENGGKQATLIQQLQSELALLKDSLQQLQSGQADASLNNIFVRNNGSEFRVSNSKLSSSFFFCDFEMNRESGNGDVFNLRRTDGAASSLINYAGSPSASDIQLLDEVFSSRNIHAGSGLSEEDAFFAMRRSNLLSFIRDCNAYWRQIQSASSDKANELTSRFAAQLEQLQQAQSSLQSELDENAKLRKALENAVEIVDSDFGFSLSKLSEVGDSNGGLASPLARLESKKIALLAASADGSKQLSTVNDNFNLQSDATTTRGSSMTKGMDNKSAADSFFFFKPIEFSQVVEAVNQYIAQLEATKKSIETDNAAQKRLNQEQNEKLKSLLAELNAFRTGKSNADAQMQANQELRNQLQDLSKQLEASKADRSKATTELEKLKALFVNVESMGVTFKVSNSIETALFTFQKMVLKDDALLSADMQRYSKVRLTDSYGPFPTISTKTSTNSNTTLTATSNSNENGQLKYFAFNEKELLLAIETMNNSVNKWVELVAAKDRYCNGLIAQKDALTAAAARIESELTQRIHELSDKLDAAGLRIDELTTLNQDGQKKYELALEEIGKLNDRFNKYKDKFVINKLQLEASKDIINRSFSNSEILSTYPPINPPKPASTSTSASATASTSNRLQQAAETEALVEILVLSSGMDGRSSSYDEKSPSKYCAIDEKQLLSIIETVNAKLRGLSNIRSVDLSKLAQKTKNIEDLKAEIKKLQNSLNEALRQNDYLRNLKVENSGDSLRVANERESATFQFCSFVREGFHNTSGKETKFDNNNNNNNMNYNNGDLSGKFYALERRNGPVTTICYGSDERVYSNGYLSTELAGTSGRLGNQFSLSNSSDAFQSPNKGVLRLGQGNAHAGRKSGSFSSQVKALAPEDGVDLYFTAVEKAEMSRFLESLNKALIDLERALADKSKEVRIVGYNSMFQVHNSLNHYKYDQHYCCEKANFIICKVNISNC